MLRNLLLIWGAISLVGIVGLGAFVTYRLGPGNQAQIDSASLADAEFVLNWCGLGADRIDEIVHSYVSARSFTGDHVDAYAIRISRVDVDELAAPVGPGPGQWYRGDQLPPVVSDAVEFVVGWLGGDEIEWFPGGTELRSENMFVYPWAIHLRGATATAVELIFVRPSDNMVFYFSAQV